MNKKKNKLFYVFIIKINNNNKYNVMGEIYGNIIMEMYIALLFRKYILIKYN